MSDPKKDIITEADLLKSLEKLEGKKDEVVVPKEQEVKTEELKKSALDSVRENSGLRKSLEVSSFLKSFTETISLHVDESLAVLQKSVNEGAQRDLAIVRVLETLAKSIDGIREDVKKFGETPAAAPKTQTAANGSKVLEKSGHIENKTQTPEDTKKQVLHGLERLAKSEKPGSSEFNRVAQAVVKFESTGQISDEMLREAMSSAKK